MLRNKRRLTVPVAASHRIRMNRDASDTHEVSSTETDLKLKEADSSASSTRSQQPSRASKRTTDDKLLGSMSGRSHAQSTASGVTYTGSISVNYNCLIPADSMENALHYTSESLSPNTHRLESLIARASVDSAASTISTSTTSSGKARRSSKTPTSSSRPHSTGENETVQGKPNGIFTSAGKAKVESSANDTKLQLGASPRSTKSSTHNTGAQTKTNKGSAQTGKVTQSARARDDVTTENGVPDSGRKSVTIMLKTSPTHEFHSTKALQTQHSTCVTPNTRPQTKKVAEVVALHEKQESGSSQSTADLASNYNTTSVTPSETAIAEVLTIVSHLKDLRRRPIQSAIIDLGQRNHNLSENEVLSALNTLVSRGQLNEVAFSDGISYRFGPPIVARGDLSHPNTLSAKIKAKYASKIKRKRGQKVPSAPPGSKRSSSSAEVHGTAAKKTKANSTVSNSTPAHPTHGPWATPANQSWPAYQSTFGRVLKPTAVRAIAFSQLLRNGSLANQSLDAPNSDKGNGAVLSAIRLSHTAESGSTTVQDNSTDPGSVLHSTGPPANGVSSTSRRSSSRQSDTVYKFKSILVKRNVDGGFTEIWLQSPGSLLKNAFTIQVLEELTAALNQAVFDASRLVMICGMGTVFSAGIDLTVLTGPLPCRSMSANSLHSHSNSASAPWDQAHTVPSAHQCYCASQSTSSTGNCNKFVHSNSATCAHNSSNRPVNPNISCTDQSVCQRLGSTLRAFLLALVAFPKPVVVGVNGPAMGLAVAMLPLCDLVYVSDAATFQIPYTKLCQIPEGGASFTLASLVGLPLANDLLLTGRKLSAREALQRGLASDLLYPKCFKEELVMRCRKLAASSPMALEMTKCILRMQHRERIEFVINTECRKLIELWQTLEFRSSALEFLLKDMGDFL
ncbi:unnamed protein product [Echinostoma caproni]|uniref:H15 domain-containing protein n=1 Tax=Echinostoma caproni TaxID=27848 RepID=A0A183AKG2_9TREM|nr:unnamed protein product [Echinostoma caproni]